MSDVLRAADALADAVEDLLGVAHDVGEETQQAAEKTVAYRAARDAAPADEPDPLTWPGVASAPGTSDRIEAVVAESWSRHRELHFPNADENAEALIEHAVHVTISMLQQDPCIADTAASSEAARGAQT